MQYQFLNSEMKIRYVEEINIQSPNNDKPTSISQNLPSNQHKTGNTMKKAKNSEGS